MPIYRINDLPLATGITSDDLLLIMDDPAGEAITKKIPASLVNLGGGDLSSYFNTSLLAGSGIAFVHHSENNTLTIVSSGTMGGGGSTTVVQLGSVSGTINTNATLGDIFDLTLASSGILANPSGSVDGQSLRWRISYANSGIPLTLGNNFRIPSSASSPLPFSTSSGTMDMLGATYDSSRNKWDIIAFVPGY
jgi:hypothetical protein